MTPSTIVADAQDSLMTMNRIVSLLRSRCFEVLSITVARSETPGVARLTIVIDSERTRPERVVAYLAKLNDVWSVTELENNVATRELALVRIVCPAGSEPRLDGVLSDAFLIERDERSAVLAIVAEPLTIDQVLAGMGAPVSGFVRSGALSLPPAGTAVDGGAS